MANDGDCQSTSRISGQEGEGEREGGSLLARVAQGGDELAVVAGYSVRSKFKSALSQKALKDFCERDSLLQDHPVGVDGGEFGEYWGGGLLCCPALECRPLP